MLPVQSVLVCTIAFIPLTIAYNCDRLITEGNLPGHRDMLDNRQDLKRTHCMPGERGCLRCKHQLLSAFRKEPWTSDLSCPVQWLRYDFTCQIVQLDSSLIEVACHGKEQTAQRCRLKACEHDL